MGHGAKLQWKEGPPKPFHHGVSLRKEDYVGNQKEFMDKEKERALATGAWEPATCTRYVSKVFLVPKPNGKWRLVMDFRWLNSHCREFKCRFETLKALQRLARRGDYMFSFDLQDGYHAIGIAPEDRKYFTFCLDGEYFQAAALPFGWNMSPYVFVKTMRVLVQALRSPTAALDQIALQEMARGQTPGQRLRRAGGRSDPRVRGLRVLPYMDDFLIICRTRAEALRARHRVSEVLEALGLKRNPDKGHWDVTQRLEHLGMLIDTKKGLFQVTPSRLAKIIALAKDLVFTSKGAGRLVTAR